MKNQQIYIEYNKYNKYKMKTIAVSDEVHRKISELGNKNETYSQILERLCESAEESQLAKLFLNIENTTDARDLPW